MNTRRGHGGQVFRRVQAPALGGQGLGQFHVGGVIACGCKGDGILSGVGQHMKLMGMAAADGAGVGQHRPKRQPQTGEDPAIGLVHGLVGLRQGGGVHMEGIGVLHQKLPAPHHPEAGADLVAEFPLDLIEVHRQLFIASVLPAYQIGDDFFMGGAKTEIPFMAIPQAQQFRSILFPTTGFLPQFRRLHRRHQQFHRPGPVHLLPDHRLGFTQYPQSQGQPGIDPGGQLANQTGPQHQLMTDDLGIGRDFL